MLSLNVVANPFSLEAAPNEAIPTEPIKGAHDCKTKRNTIIRNVFFILNTFLKLTF